MGQAPVYKGSWPNASKPRAPLSLPEVMKMGMRLVSVTLPEKYLEGLEELVRMGRYTNRSQAIRVAVRDLLLRELWNSGSR